MADNILEIEARADFSALFGESQAAAAAVEDSSRRIKTAMDSAGSAPQKLQYSMRDAREATRGLGEEIGVRMPRFVGTFISGLSGVGPALAAAFSVVAVIGFAQVLSQIPDAIDKIVGKISGWTKEEKDSYANALTQNKERRDALDKIAVDTLKLAGIGAGAIGKEIVDTKALNLELKQKSDRIKELGAATGALLAAETGITERKQIGFDPRTRTPIEHDITTKTLPAMYDSWEQVRKKILENQDEVQKLKGRIDEISKVDLSASGKRLGVGVADQRTKDEAADEAYMKHLASQDMEQFHLAKATADAEEKLSEEMSADTQRRAQQDLEAFERIARAKVSLQEAVNADELSNLQQQAAERSRVAKEEHQPGGQQITVARTGYDEVATKLAEMIGLEEQFRISVADANDPKQVEQFIASQIKEMALVKQMQEAWGKLQKVVDDAAVKTRKAYADAIMGIGKDFDKGFISWMNGQESFGRAMRQVWVGIADSVVSSLIKVGFQMLANAVLGEAIDDQQKLDSAKSAAGGAYKSVMTSAIPFPFNFPIAIGAAGAAFAAVMAFEQGAWKVPGTGMAMLHAGEAVMPAGPAEAWRSGGGGGHTFHQTLNFNGNADSDTVARGGRQIVKMAMRELRRMNR